MAQGADGDVRFIIRGDDSQLENDLAQAERRVERSARETGDERERVEERTSDTIRREQESVTEHHRQQNDERVRDDQETGREREDNEKKVAGSIKDAIKDQVESTPVGSAVSKWTDGFTGAKAAALGVGVGIAAVGVKSVSVADEMRQAMNQFVSTTGIATSGTEYYQSVLEEIYKNNYGESFEDIAEAMATVRNQIGDLDQENLQNLTESAFALRDAFGYDVSETVRSAKTMMDQFGISGDEAFNLITQGAQNGLDFSGELLDSVNEYSVQFQKMGFDAEDMFSIFSSGAEAGAFNLDKIGDAVKEMSLRVIDGSDTTKEGFETIGLDADIMSKKFAAGGETAKEAFEQTIDALASMKDPLKQNIAGVDLFGTMWEDLGPEVVTQLSTITENIDSTDDAMSRLKDVKYDDLGSMFEGLKRNLELLLVPLGNMLMPILELLIQSVLPVLTGLLTPLMDAIMAVIDPVLSLISEAIQPMIDVITFLMDFAIQPLIEILSSLPDIFKGTLGDAFDSTKKVFENIKGIFKGVITFLKGVFTGDWKGAWEGVKSIFSNIASALGNIFKTPINFIIGIVNGFIRGLNKIQIPDWVPLVGGKGFHISEIPKLKKGMDFVPADDYPAFLHYGERVMTKEENAAFTAAGGLAGLERGEPFSETAGKEARFDIYLQLDGRTVARQTARYTGEQLSWEEI